MVQETFYSAVKARFCQLWANIAPTTMTLQHAETRGPYQDYYHIQSVRYHLYFEYSGGHNVTLHAYNYVFLEPQRAYQLSGGDAEIQQVIHAILAMIAADGAASSGGGQGSAQHRYLLSLPFMSLVTKL